MNNYDKYSKMIVRSVDHIFKNFLSDDTITEIYESQPAGKDSRVSIEINGTIKGEIIINFPIKTLDQITRQLINNSSAKSVKKYYEEVAGEIANMITGTFANQLQFMDHNIQLSAPEYNDDTPTTKTLYDNINLTFKSGFGGFEIDLYYRENR